MFRSTVEVSDLLDMHSTGVVFPESLRFIGAFLPFTLYKKDHPLLPLEKGVSILRKVLSTENTYAFSSQRWSDETAFKDNLLIYIRRKATSLAELFPHDISFPDSPKDISLEELNQQYFTLRYSALDFALSCYQQLDFQSTVCERKPSKDLNILNPSLQHTSLLLYGSYPSSNAHDIDLMAIIKEPLPPKDLAALHSQHLEYNGLPIHILTLPEKYLDMYSFFGTTLWPENIHVLKGSFQHPLPSQAYKKHLLLTDMSLQIHRLWKSIALPDNDLQYIISLEEPFRSRWKIPKLISRLQGLYGHSASLNGFMESYPGSVTFPEARPLLARSALMTIKLVEDFTQKNKLYK